MAEPRTCVRCGRIRTIRAREMCGSCYQIVRRQNDPDHKAKHAAQMREWRRENPEKAHAIEKRRYKKDKEKRKAAGRAYYQRNREKLCQYQRDWRRANPEQRDHYKRRRVNKLNGLPCTLTYAEWVAIQEQYDHLCAYCQAEGKKLVREHMLPADRGGGFTKENIVPSCRSCNCRKKTMTAQEFVDSGFAKSPHPVLLARLQEASQPEPFRFVQLQF